MFSQGMLQRPQVNGSVRGWRVMTSSLSGRILVFVLLFLMVSGALIYFPSVVRYHRELLSERIESAELAILPFTEAAGAQLSQRVRTQLLTEAGVLAVVLRGGGQNEFYLIGDQEPPPIAAVYNTGAIGFITEMRDVLRCLTAPEGRIVRIDAQTAFMEGVTLFVVASEDTIRNELLRFAIRALGISAFIACVTALLLFLSLYFFVVRPMNRLTEAIVRFRANPEDPSRIYVPSGREDEIGVAEEELGNTQREIYSFIREKTRLAQLGAAVAKIQHDLRNILTSAQIASDRLVASNDPVVRRITPRLVAALDRAIALATHTLRYGKADESPPERKHIVLHALADEVAAAVFPDASDVVFENRIPETMALDADPEQLYRVLLNLVTNAHQAMDLTRDRGTSATPRIWVEAFEHSSGIEILVSDNGPGIPPQLCEKLFKPFTGTSRSGGTGLGLSIARELAQAHGGDVSLVATGENGTRFRIFIPDHVWTPAKSA